MRSGIIKTFTVFNLIVFGVRGGWAAEYRVRAGETLSRIAHEFIPGRIYGTGGSLSRILALNPNLKSKPNLIYLNQKIEVPSALARNTASENTSAPVDPPPVVSEDIDHHFVAGLGYHFKTFTARDPVNSSSAKLFTSSDLEFDATWSQEWNQCVSTFFEFGFEKLNFEPSNNPGKTLNNTEQAPAHFTLGADIHAASNLVLRTSASYGQELFTGTQNGSISIDSVFIPKFSEEIIFTAFTKGRTSVGAEGGGSYLLNASAGSYSVNSGYAVNGAVFLSQNFGIKNKNTLTLFVGYENTQQNTSLVHQTIGDGFAKLMFSIPIF